MNHGLQGRNKRGRVWEKDTRHLLQFYCFSHRWEGQLVGEKFRMRAVNRATTARRLGCANSPPCR